MNQQQVEGIDIEGNGQGYSGTFRWKSSKVLPRMSNMKGRTKAVLAKGGGE